MGKVLGLRGLIYSKYECESALAKVLQWPRQKLNKITTGKREPTLGEVHELAVALDVPFMDVAKFFLQQK